MPFLGSGKTLYLAAITTAANPWPIKAHDGVQVLFGGVTSVGLPGRCSSYQAQPAQGATIAAGLAAKCTPAAAPSVGSAGAAVISKCSVVATPGRATGENAHPAQGVTVSASPRFAASTSAEPLSACTASAKPLNACEVAGRPGADTVDSEPFLSTKIEGEACT